MNITEKVETVSHVATTSIKDDLKLIKENIKEFSVENNFENILSKLKDTQVELKPITKNIRKNKEKKIKPVFAFTNKKVEKSAEMEKFGEKLKKSLDKILDEKLSKLKEKISKKTMKKSMKLMEKFISKKKNSSQDLEQVLPNGNLQVHPGVTCDDCGVSPIQGNRYKCAVCHNFDFCPKCEEKNKDLHPHPFILIRHPDRAPHSISCIVKESCPIIQKEIPFNKDYKLADAILNNSIIVDTNELSAQCVTSYLDVYVREDFLGEIVKILKLKNNGKKSWPKPVYMTCHTESSAVYGYSVPIKIKVEPGKESNVEIKLNNKQLKVGEYVSVWQLQNEKKEFFGDKIVLLLKVTPALSKPVSVPIKIETNSINTNSSSNQVFVSSNNNIVERPQEDIYDSFVYQCQVDELRSAYNLKNFDDKVIKKAAVEAKGDVDMTFQILINQQKK
jgi:hypothetical protein